MRRSSPDRGCTTLLHSASQFRLSSRYSLTRLPRRSLSSRRSAAKTDGEGGSHITRQFYYCPDVINGILKCVQCRVDLGGVEIDDAQCLWRESKFPITREFDECWDFSREMIG